MAPFGTIYSWMPNPRVLKVWPTDGWSAQQALWLIQAPDSSRGKNQWLGDCCPRCIPDGRRELHQRLPQEIPYWEGPRLRGKRWNMSSRIRCNSILFSSVRSPCDSTSGRRFVSTSENHAMGVFPDVGNMATDADDSSEAPRAD